jgi:hypothetical protein
MDSVKCQVELGKGVPRELWRRQSNVAVVDVTTSSTLMSTLSVAPNLAKRADVIDESLEAGTIKLFMAVIYEFLK